MRKEPIKAMIDLGDDIAVVAEKNRGDDNYYVVLIGDHSEVELVGKSFREIIEITDAIVASIHELETIDGLIKDD
jgi:hypothetical protein